MCLYRIWEWKENEMKTIITILFMAVSACASSMQWWNPDAGVWPQTSIGYIQETDQISSLDSVWVYTKIEVEFDDVFVATQEWQNGTPSNYLWCTQPGVYDAELDAFRYSLPMQEVDNYILAGVPFNTPRVVWPDAGSVIHTYWRPGGSAYPYELAPFEGCIVFFGEGTVALERDTWASIKTSF